MNRIPPRDQSGARAESDPLPVLFHEPRCSKSRAAKALLEERGIAFRERRYREEPLDLRELRALGALLGLPPAAFVREGEEAYGELGLSPASSEDELFAALARRPELLQRPILVCGSRARIGRPPEAILEILEQD